MNMHALNAIFAVTGRPGYVKTAEADAVVGGYADALARKYPCHSKSATWLSNAEAVQDGAAPEVIAKIAAAADLWGIGADVRDATAKLAAVGAQVSEGELSDDDFALCETANGTKVRKFASVDAETTVDAAVAFHDHRHQYPLAWRKTAAVKLLARAETFGAVLPEYVGEYLLKAAGLAVATPEAIDSIMTQRVNRSKIHGDPACEKLAFALNELAENTSLRHDMDLVDDTLKLVDAYDRQTKIAQFYGHGVDLPEEMLTVTAAGLAKVASCAKNIVRLVNGHNVDVRHIDPELLDTVSDGLAKMSHAKLAEVLPTLPKPEADLLVQLMPKTAAVAPIAGPNLGTLPGGHIVHNSPLPRPAGMVTAAAPAPTNGDPRGAFQPVDKQVGTPETAPQLYDQLNQVGQGSLGNVQAPNLQPVPAITPDDPHGIPKTSAAAVAPIMGASLGSNPPVAPMQPGPQKPQHTPVPGGASAAAHPVAGSPPPAAGTIGLQAPAATPHGADLLG